MQNSWSQTLADGFIGAFLGSSVSVIVALYAIRRSQRIERENRREDLSLAAAERLTMALLDAVRRLNQLADHNVSRSRAARAETMSAIVSELQTAVELHAPVLSPPAFASLPDLTTQVLGTAVEAIEARERTVLQQERLSESDEDRAYAVDRNATELRQILIGFLRDVTRALTAYRRGLPSLGGGRARDAGAAAGDRGQPRPASALSHEAQTRLGAESPDGTVDRRVELAQAETAQLDRPPQRVAGLAVELVAAVRKQRGPPLPVERHERGDRGRGRRPTGSPPRRPPRWRSARPGRKATS